MSGIHFAAGSVEFLVDGCAVAGSGHRRDIFGGLTHSRAAALEEGRRHTIGAVGPDRLFCNPLALGRRFSVGRCENTAPLVGCGNLLIQGQERAL